MERIFSFQKQKQSDAKIKNKFIFAIRGGSATNDNTQDLDAKTKYITNEIFPIVDKYYYAQNDFDKFFFSQDETQKQQVTNKMIDFLQELVLQSETVSNSRLTPKDFREYRFKCAENVNNSICCEMIMLENALFTLYDETADEKDVNKAQEMVDAWQERFMDYKYGSTEPVDENADLFLSYLAPMLLSYYGIETNKSFIDATYDLLKKNNYTIPQELEILKHGVDMENIINQSNIREEEKKLKDRFYEYGISNAYMGLFINKKPTEMTNNEKNEQGKKFNQFYTLVESFIIANEPALQDLQKLVDDETLTTYMQIVWEFKNGVADDENSITSQVKKAYEEQTEKSFETLLLYSPILLNSPEVLKELAKQNTQQPTTENKKQPKKQPTKKDAVKQKELKISFDEAMLKLAKHLFTTASNYDFDSLKSFKIKRTMKSFDDVLTFDFYPFEETIKNLENRHIESLNDNMAALVETYQNIQNVFKNLGPNIQKGFLQSYQKNGQSYIDATQIEYQEMIQNYVTLSLENKNFLNELAKENKQVELDLKQAKEQTSKRRNNRMDELMKKYNLNKPTLDEQDDMEQSVEAFFTNDLSEKTLAGEKQ